MPALAYMGDSTNDGPLFAAIALSIGVANVSPYLPQLEKETSPIEGKGGHGFAEAIDILLQRKTLHLKRLSTCIFTPTRLVSLR